MECDYLSRSLHSRQLPVRHSLLWKGPQLFSTPLRVPNKMNLPMSFRGACDEESKSFAFGNMGRLRFFTSLRFVQNDILLGVLNLYEGKADFNPARVLCQHGFESAALDVFAFLP